jgi:hypothetical protein
MRELPGCRHAVHPSLRHNPTWPDLTGVVSHTGWSRLSLPPLAIHFFVKLDSSILACRPELVDEVLASQNTAGCAGASWLNAAVHPSSGEGDTLVLEKRKDIEDSFAVLLIKERCVGRIGAERDCVLLTFREAVEVAPESEQHAIDLQPRVSRPQGRPG